MTKRDADADVNRWFGVNVRAELKARGWSSRELSRRSGASASTFTRVSVGQGVALSVAVRIADALGMKVDDLVKGSCTRCAGRPAPGFICGACGLAGPEPQP